MTKIKNEILKLPIYLNQGGEYLTKKDIVRLNLRRLKNSCIFWKYKIKQKNKRLIQK